MNKPRVLVTGASGFIGKATCHALNDAGYSVTGLVRSLTKDMPASVFYEAGGIEQDHYFQVINELIVDVDVVIHLASMLKANSTNRNEEHVMRLVNVDGTRRLLEAAVSANVKRFIYLSSISVNGTANSGKAFTEDSEVNPSSAYARTKCDAEKLILDASNGGKIESVIVRPPMVLGRGIKSNLFVLLRKLISRHIPLPLGLVNNKRSYVSLPGMVDFLMRCTTDDNAANQVFLVADGEVSLKDIALAVANNAGTSVLMLPVPRFFLRVGGILTGKRQWSETLLDDIVIDTSKAREMLGWKPVQSREETLAQSVE